LPDDVAVINFNGRQCQATKNKQPEQCERADTLLSHCRSTNVLKRLAEWIRDVF